MCELIWVTVDPRTCAPNPAMQPLAADLVRAVMELRPRFTTAVRVAQAGEQGGVGRGKKKRLRAAGAGGGGALQPGRPARGWSLRRAALGLPDACRTASGPPC